VQEVAFQYSARAAAMGFKEVEVDGDIFNRFMQLAHGNTLRGIETCGILAVPENCQEKYRVTTLIIPKQTATSDTCTTTNEDELLLYLQENDLMTVGWIHTHPTQRCFLSSMDLHAHLSYQLLMKEAIAVVVAPRFQPKYAFHSAFCSALSSLPLLSYAQPSLSLGTDVDSFGIFRLTDPGLEFVRNCRQSGFHPHNAPIDLFQTCEHVTLKWGSSDVNIVDIR